jgi:hypothetical protein
MPAGLATGVDSEPRMSASGRQFGVAVGPLVAGRRLSTNQGVGSSNLSGRAKFQNWSGSWESSCGQVGENSRPPPQAARGFDNLASLRARLDARISRACGPERQRGTRPRQRPSNLSGRAKFQNWSGSWESSYDRAGENSRPPCGGLRGGRQQMASYSWAPPSVSRSSSSLLPDAFAKSAAVAPR